MMMNVPAILHGIATGSGVRIFLFTDTENTFTAKVLRVNWIGSALELTLDNGVSFIVIWDTQEQVQGGDRAAIERRVVGSSVTYWIDREWVTADPDALLCVGVVTDII